MFWLVSFANLVASIATLLFFSYRYVWFATETVPNERVFVTAIMAVVSFMVWGITGESMKELRDNKNNKKIW